MANELLTMFTSERMCENKTQWRHLNSGEAAVHDFGEIDNGRLLFMGRDE